MSTLARITVTVPEDLVARADARARRTRRSRSWVFAEALGRYLGGESKRAVREEIRAPYGVQAGLGEQRLAQLTADLKLTPEERLHEAETATDDALRLHRVPRVPCVLAFERYEDFLEWKRRDLVW